MADITARIARAIETVACLPEERWEHIENGRIYLAGGDMIASVREQIPGDVDPDGDDPKAWEIGDAAVEEAALRAEAVALLVNARAALLDVAEAGARLQRAHSPDGLMAEKLPAWDALDAAIDKLRGVL